MSCDDSLSIPDLGESSVVACSSPQEERVSARVAGECRQPQNVFGRSEQARVAAYGVARRDIGPAAVSVGADPVVDSFAVTRYLPAELFFGGDTQGLVREQVHPRRGDGFAAAEICGYAGLKAAAEHPT